MKASILLSRRWVVAPVLAAALAILLTAIPRTIAAFVSGGGEPVIRTIQNQQKVSIEELETVIDAQKRGLFWVNDAEMEAKLGLAHLLIAEQLGAGDPSAGMHLENARHALRSSLGRSPSNPYAWTLLAYAEFLQLGTWQEPAIAALRMAVLTGAHEPPILWSRLRLAFLAWNALGSADRDLFAEQARYAWDLDPKQLATLAIGLNATNAVRAALVGDTAATNAFEGLVKQLKAGS